MADLHRLSPYNIKDSIIRSMLYTEIRAGSIDWSEWEISIDEVKMPELIAMRFYAIGESAHQLKWLIAITSELDDLRAELKPGSVISLPPIQWIRERIRHYQSLEQSLAALNERKLISVSGIEKSAAEFITKDLASIGVRIYYNRDRQKITLDSRGQVTSEILQAIEDNKLSIFLAISGVDAVGVSLTGSNSVAGEINLSELEAIIDTLNSDTQPVLPSDEVNNESLNRHKYSFDAKFLALADFFQALL